VAVGGAGEVGKFIDAAGLVEVGVDEFIAVFHVAYFE
jgi:hypothetical protein